MEFLLTALPVVPQRGLLFSFFNLRPIVCSLSYDTYFISFPPLQNSVCVLALMFSLSKCVGVFCCTPRASVHKKIYSYCLNLQIRPTYFETAKSFSSKHSSAVIFRACH